MSDNSNIALEKLRRLISDYQEQGKPTLPSRADLMKSFEIGQRALRRALKVLEHEGVITIQSGSRVLIGPNLPGSIKHIPKFHDILEVMETRRFFEGYLCELAAPNITQLNIKRMTKAQNQLLKLNNTDFDLAELWDGTFHREIAIATKSPLLLSLFDQINIIRQSEEWRQNRQHVRTDNFIIGNHEDHTRILSALIKQDGQEARKAMESHLSRLIDRLITTENEES